MRTRAACLIVLLAWASPAQAENWPGWRGPRGDGTSAEKGLPTTWSRTQNVRWNVKLPGPGNSTPVVWGQRIFLTQALDRKGTERALLCLDRADGKLLWQKSVPFKGEEPTHGTNPYCAASPVTDGERVIASHGSAGVVCYDLDGKLLWQRDLGPFVHIWGTAASPILHDDLVILNCGPGERTFLLALNKKTGADVWKVEETGGKSGRKGDSEWVGSWSTPRIVDVQGRRQLIMTWPHSVKAYGPNTGDIIWTCGGLTPLVYTSPLVTPELVVAMSGFHGSALAVKTGGTGDVTPTRRLWHHTSKNPQRIGSGIILGDYLYMVNAGPGTVQCIDLKTGKDRWEGKRLGSAFWGSLVLADGKFYATDQEGDTYVFAAKPEFEQIAQNRLGEHTNASIAISDGDIFIRTYEHLWCVGRQSQPTFETYLRKSVVDKRTLDVFLSPKELSWARFDPVTGYRLGNYLPRDGIQGSSTISTTGVDGARTAQAYIHKRCRINTYGDSFTLCHQVSDSETWQEYLAGHLGEPIRNFGMGGFGVYQSYRRLIREEQTDHGAPYVILYIWGDDHIRSLLRCRHAAIYPWWNDDGGRSFHNNFWANIEMNLTTGRLEERANLLPTPESLFRMSDPDWTVQALKDDLALNMLVYAQGSVADLDMGSVRRLATHLDFDDAQSLAGPQPPRAVVGRLLNKYGFAATKDILTKARDFAARHDKKLLVVIFEPSIVKSLVDGKPRYDQEIVDFLKERKFHYFDMNLVHVEDYKSFRIPLDQYAKRYFIGHYSPAGNHFFAYAIKDTVVRWLDPPPITYQNNKERWATFEGYLKK